MIEQRVLTRRIRIRRSLSTDEEGVVATFLIDAESQTPRRVRIVDRIPDAIAVERLLFHPDYAPLEVTREDRRLTLEVVVSPPDATVTGYGILTSDATDDVEFRGPTVESVRAIDPGDAEELVSRQSGDASSDGTTPLDGDDPRIQRLLSRLAETAAERDGAPSRGAERAFAIDESGPGTGDVKTATTDGFTPEDGPEGPGGSSPGDELEPESGARDDAGGDDPGHSDPGDDHRSTAARGAHVEAVIEAIKAGDLEADAGRRLRATLAEDIATDTDADRGRPESDARSPATHDEDGSALFGEGGLGEELPADIQRLIHGIGDRIEALEGEVRRVDEELDRTRERIATLEERASEVDRIEDRLAAAEADLEDVRASIDTDLAALRDDVEAGKEWRRSVVAVFGEGTASPDRDP